MPYAQSHTGHVGSFAFAVFCRVSQCVAGCYCVLQGVAVCCSALQCIAVSCSVSMCVVPCATSRTGHVAQFARLHTPDLNFFLERCPQLNAPCTRRAGKLRVGVFNRHAAELLRKSEN